MRITERQISKLVKRIVNEDEEFDIKKTVMDTSGFEEDDIPEECMGENPGMSQIDMIEGCIGKITEKSTKLNDSLKALGDMLSKAKSMTSESRRYRNRYY